MHPKGLEVCSMSIAYVRWAKGTCQVYGVTVSMMHKVQGGEGVWNICVNEVGCLRMCQWKALPSRGRVTVLEKREPHRPLRLAIYLSHFFLIGYNIQFVCTKSFPD